MAISTSNKKYSFSQKIIYRIMAKLYYGKVTFIVDGQQQEFIGSKNQDIGSVVIRVNNKKFFSNVLLGGTNGAAKSYFQGFWETDNLSKLIQIIIINEAVFQKMDSKLTLLIQNLVNFYAVIKHNNIDNAKKNILAHYDLGNEFFKLFLDEKMSYSCALYESEQVDLDAASIHKLRTICNELQLKPEDHLLEIGSGWGGLCILAAQEYGCKVTTTTISDKQYSYLKNQITQLGLDHRIEVLNKDYRDLTGHYDKLVSIEMIEAVGSRYFKKFFEKCNALVKPGGLFFLQAITINDKAYNQAKKNTDFIKKYIFPGGCLPSLKVINESIAKYTEMQLIKCNDIGNHYVRTLSDWMTRFHSSTDQIKSMGFTEQFIRLWHFYFSYCIAGFQQAYISDIHILWQKRDSNHA
jgi:cyclopropane-fatty-acyl-phospholipid synthase